MGLITILASLGCNMPHLGGIKAADDRSKVQLVLKALVSLAAPTTMDLRLDDEVQVSFSSTPTYALFSTGLVVTLQAEDLWLDISPLTSVMDSSACCKKVKNTLSKLALDGNKPIQATLTNRCGR